MQNFRWSGLCALLAAPVAVWDQQEATASAQQAATAPVEILVNDPSGAGVPHARVRVVPSPDDSSKKLETDEKGRLELKLKAGGYALFVSEQGEECRNFSK